MKFVGLPKNIQSHTAFLEKHSENADAQNIKIAFKKTSTFYVTITQNGTRFI